MLIKYDEQNSRRDSKWLLIECLQNQAFFHWILDGNRCGAIFNTYRCHVWAIKHLIISNRLTRGKWIEGEHKGNKKNKNFFYNIVIQYSVFRRCRQPSMPSLVTFFIMLLLIVAFLYAQCLVCQSGKAGQTAELNSHTSRVGRSYDTCLTSLLINITVPSHHS